MVLTSLEGGGFLSCLFGSEPDLFPRPHQIGFLSCLFGSEHSTTFFLAIDLGTSSFGESIGQVSRPFKCGDSTEIEKWKAYKSSWPAGGVAVDCVFEMAAGSQDSSKMVLVSIAPTPRQKAA